MSQSQFPVPQKTRGSHINKPNAHSATLGFLWLFAKYSRIIRVIFLSSSFFFFPLAILLEGSDKLRSAGNGATS